MKKVLIAEDEYLLRLGVKSIIDWPTYGYHLVGEACNGKEALEMFKKHMPSILITDIKMPILDGIELIQAVKKIKPDIQVIILTHYDDFNYAKKAITLGASRYILKSELNQELLLEALHVLPNDAESFAREERDPPPSLKKQFLDIVLGVKENQAAAEFFPSSRYFIVSRECMNQSITLNDNFQSSFSNMVTDAPEVLLCKYATHSSGLLAECLFDASAYPNNQEAIHAVGSYLKTNNRNIQQYYDFQIRSGISESGDVTAFKEMYAQAEMARKASFFEADNVAFYHASVNETVTIHYEMVNSFLAAQDQKRMEQYIVQLFTELKAQRNYDQAIHIAISLMSLAKSNVFHYKLETAFPELEKDFNDIALSDMMHVDQLEAYLQNAYKKLFDCFEGKSTTRYSHIINRCIAYIKNNYDQNISLSDAAEAIGVSKSYLSLLFKQETSINFSAYLAEYRIRKAKELFKNTDMKVYEVADATGFSNSYYFSKVFKDIVGSSCKDYKSEISRKELL